MSQVSPLMFDIIAQDRSRAAFDSAGRNADTMAAKARKAGADTQNSMNAVRGSVANLAAQFNDIGVQLAGGTNPFLIAIQQGTQINQVIGQTGAAGAVQLLGSAFASLINPVSLATIGFIAAGGTAVQYFADLISEGAKSEETLQRQTDLIGKVAQQWGDAVPALREYVDELERAEKRQNLKDAVNIMVDREWKDARDDLADLNIELSNMVLMYRQAGAEQDTIMRLQDAWASLTEATSSGREDQEAFRDVIDAVGAAMQETGIPQTESWTKSMGALSEAITTASRKANELRLQQALATAPQQTWTPGAFPPVFQDADGQWYSEGQFRPTGNVPAPATRGTPELSGFPWETGGRGAASGRISDAQREAEAYQKVIQTLEDEQAMIGRSNAERRILQLQRRANVEAASEEGQAIEMFVRQIDAQQDAFRKAEAAGKFMRDNLVDSFSMLIPEIETGNRALDSFINRLIQAGAEAAIFGSGPLGGGGSGILATIFSAVGFGGPRAVGGAVNPYTDYQVGENGPEIVRIGARGGFVGSSDRGEQGQSAAGRGGVADVRVYVDQDGNWQAAVERISDERVGRAAPAIVGQANRMVMPTMARFQTQKAGGDYRNG